MTDWIEKNSGLLLTWFGSLFVLGSGMFWRLRQTEKECISLKVEVEVLKKTSAEKKEVDDKLEKLEEHLHEHIQRLEADVKNQGDQNRNYIDKMFSEFTKIRGEINDGLKDMTEKMNASFLKLTELIHDRTT